MKFLGIDFGWQSGASGLCCLNWENDRLHLLDLDRRESIADILAWVECWASRGDKHLKSLIKSRT